MNFQVLKEEARRRGLRISDIEETVSLFSAIADSIINNEDNNLININVIPPKVQDILNHETIMSDSSSESSDCSSDSEDPPDDKNGDNGSNDEIEDEQEINEEGNGAEIQLPEQANDGEITCNTERYGDTRGRIYVDSSSSGGGQSMIQLEHEFEIINTNEGGADTNEGGASTIEGGSNGQLLSRRENMLNSFLSSANNMTDPLDPFPKLLSELNNNFSSDCITKCRNRIAQFVTLACLKDDLTEFLSSRFISPASYEEFASYLGFEHTTRSRKSSFSSQKLDEISQNPYFGQNFFRAFATHFHQSIYIGPATHNYAYNLRAKPSKSQMEKFIYGVSIKIDSIVMPLFSILHFIETSSANSDGHLLKNLVKALSCESCIDAVYKDLYDNFADIFKGGLL